MRPYVHAVPVPTIGIGPEAEAFVMLRGQDHVAGARPHKDIGPLVRLEQFGGELRRKVLVLEVRTIGLGVELRRGAALVLQGIPIPFGVAPFRPPRRHGINAPVDEDAKLGFVEPGWDGARIQRLPVGLVFLGGGRKERQGQQHRN